MIWNLFYRQYHNSYVQLHILRVSLTYYHNKSCADRTIIASSNGARMTFLRATVLRFPKICKSADNYKFVEAMEIVGTS